MGTIILQDNLEYCIRELEIHDGGTTYHGDNDDCGIRACCHVVSYEPHASHCTHVKIVETLKRTLTMIEEL